MEQVQLDRIDRYGHCVICCNNLIQKRVVDGVVIDMFSPLHDHAEFMLDNGSLMKVCMCKPCKQKTDLTDKNIQNDIMKAVYKGWQLEVKVLVADEKQTIWTQEYGDKHLEVMSKLSIDNFSEETDKNILESKSKELFNNKHEELKEIKHGSR